MEDPAKDEIREDSREEKTGPDSLFARLYRPGPLIFFFCVAFVALLSLGYYILTDDTPPPVVVTASNMVEIAKVYEEKTDSDMEDRVRQADLAIIEAMRESSMDLAKLDLLDVEMRTLNGRTYHYQVLQVPSCQDQDVFLGGLKARLDSRVPEATLADNGTAEARISINGLPTHRIMLTPVPMTLPTPTIKGPQLAIVIDDIGEDLHVLKGLVGLDFPVALAVWPNASHTRESVTIIQAAGRDLLMHFPMEPMGYPTYDPGDDALFVSMSDETIRRRVAENLARIPEAIGVNNHMGSKFTSHAAGMRTALTEFNRRGLFFLDSLTTGKSVGRSVARETGIPFYERDVFIDNVKDVSAITLQLRKAENLALKRGVAIAIGHPYPETLAALKAWHAHSTPALQAIPLSRLAAQ
jgi:polysaccharide deacetylase 2 family uncharacterized protein YibQ